MRKELKTRMRNKWINKKYMAIILAVLIVITSIFMIKHNSYAAWKKDNTGTYYKEKDGSLATGFREIRGVRYYFDKSGKLMTGKFYVESENAYFYSDEKDGILNGYIPGDNQFYLTDDDGKLMTGFVEHNGKRYFFDGDVNLCRGWFKSEGDWFYANKDGEVQTGFLELDGVRYYLDEDGHRIADTTMEIDGDIYVFSPEGSIDEDATILYPLIHYMNESRKKLGILELDMDSKVKACADLRAKQLVNGFDLESEEKSIEVMLNNRAVAVSGGYEFAYGGTPDYGLSELVRDIERDENFKRVIEDEKINAFGLGSYEQDGIYYFDIVLVMK